MKDICFTQAKTTAVQPKILGKSSIQGLLLYQKILVLLLSDSSSLYREDSGAGLISLLKGSNTPADQLLQALGSIACAQVKGLLDPSDVEKLKDLTASAQNGSLYITLELESGQTYTGALT